MRDGVRWIVDITYHSEQGDVDVRHHIVELYELHNLVEKGPDWHCIISIELMLARSDGEAVKTLEAADKE